MFCANTLSIGKLSDEYPTPFRLFDCWMGGALFKKESWRELDVYCLEGSILPLAHIPIPMLQKKVNCGEKDHSIFQLNKNIIFLRIPTLLPFKKSWNYCSLHKHHSLNLRNGSPQKGIEHSFWRVRELVKKRHHTMMHDFLPLKETRRSISPLSLC